MNIGQRVFDLRKQVGLNQAEFGKRIGVTRSAICNYENGSRSIGEQTILSICREFNVNEAWLRTGEGGDAAMFVKPPRNEDLATQIESFFQGGTDSFRERLISLLLRLPQDKWDVLEGYARELAAPRDAAPARTDTDIEQEANAAASEVRDQVILEKKVGVESSALLSDTGGTAGKKMA